MKGRAVILHPAQPESVKRRAFILDSLQKSGIEWTEEIEEDRAVITYAGKSKPSKQRKSRRSAPPSLTLEKCLRERHDCERYETEYWDEMIRLTAEREGFAIRIIPVRWKADEWRDTWAVAVSAHLAVNRNSDHWAITHIPTRLAAGTATTLKNAVAKARAVACWPEWSTVQSASAITPEFRRKATAALKGAA